MLHDRDRMANRRIHAEQVRTALSNLDQHHAGSDIGIESLVAEGAFKLSVRQERADSAVRQASRAIELGDSNMADRIDAIETSVNDLYRKTQCPDMAMVAYDTVAERKSATEMSPHAAKLIRKHTIYNVGRSFGIRLP